MLFIFYKKRFQFVAASIGRGNKHFDPKTKRFGVKQFYNPVPFIKQFEYETLCFISKHFDTSLQ
uniref:Uncharacterized protein n=1 Tax=viral metagenome TaxID=1070528 RepID=A0A6C0B7S7_9ZZZZ